MSLVICHSLLEVEIGMDVKDLEIYRLSLELSQQIWELVKDFEYFSKKTIGIQLVRAADSIGANIAEGFGRYYFKEKKLFFYYARGSMEETKHWLRLAFKRELLSQEQLDKISPLIDALPPKLNSYINNIGRQQSSSSDE